MRLFRRRSTEPPPLTGRAESMPSSGPTPSDRDTPVLPTADDPLAAFYSWRPTADATEAMHAYVDPVPSGLRAIVQSPTPTAYPSPPASQRPTPIGDPGFDVRYAALPSLAAPRTPLFGPTPTPISDGGDRPAMLAIPRPARTPSIDGALADLDPPDDDSPSCVRLLALPMIVLDGRPSARDEAAADDSTVKDELPVLGDLDLMRCYVDDGDFGAALREAEGVLAVDGASGEATLCAVECREQLASRYLASLGLTTVFRADRDALGVASPGLDGRAYFLLSLVDGALSVDELLDISRMPRFETLRLLDCLVAGGLLVRVSR